MSTVKRAIGSITYYSHNKALILRRIGDDGMLLFFVIGLAKLAVYVSKHIINKQDNKQDLSKLMFHIS